MQGTKGELVLAGFEGGCLCHTANEEGATTTEELCHVGWDAGYMGEYEDFVSAVLDAQATKGPVAEAIADLKVISALFEAARTKAWVTVNP